MKLRLAAKKMENIEKASPIWHVLQEIAENSAELHLEGIPTEGRVCLPCVVEMSVKRG